MSPVIIHELVIATTNSGKVAELSKMLADCRVPIKGLSDFTPLPEAEETGDTFAENARQKALHYGSLLKTWVLADDSGLEIDALDGAPGVYSARFAGSDAADSKQRDRANYEKVLHLLTDTPDIHRTARFRCALCLAFGCEVILEVDGVMEGTIIREPQGENGFGYDPIVWIPAAGKTVAQMNADEKNMLSHRGNALAKLRERLYHLL